jgi:Domain of unknown function DUF29
VIDSPRRDVHFQDRLRPKRGSTTVSDNASRLYERDFVRWTEQQSSALREASRCPTNLPLDWENLAEEIESLGRSQRRELRSRLMAILEHLLKLEHSPAPDPRHGWRDTIERERSEIELLLEDSPSLRREVAPMIAGDAQRVARLTTRVLRGRGEAIDLKPPAYTEDQVLGDWFPESSSPS